jgi:hypothetical protein
MRRLSARGPIKLSRRRRLWVYAITLGLWASGAAWLVLHYFLRAKGEFGPEINPAEPWALKAHGAFAFATLWLLGLLWGVHVLNGWHADRRRWSGGILLGVMLVLGLTGYLLYYAGDDALRSVISLAHWIIGLGAPAIFLLHRFVRERLAARKAQVAEERARAPVD